MSESVASDSPSVRTSIPFRYRLATVATFLALAPAHAAEPLLLLPLKNDAVDQGPLKLQTRAIDVEFPASVAAGKPSLSSFNGRTSRIEITDVGRLPIGRDPFTVMARVDLTGSDDDLPGDLVNQFDHETGKGWMLSITSRSGLVHSRSNHRQIHFGIRGGETDFGTSWTDHGRPGGSVYVQAMTVFDGSLFVGICDPSPQGKGGVFRFVPPDRWEDMQLPIKCNAVTSLVVHQGRLFAGSGKYRLAGSALAESENPAQGGEVFRLEPGGRWTNLGRLGESEAVGGMVVFRGKLHASSLYKPAGFFRLEESGRWSTPETPGGKRPEALAVHNDRLYASGYDEGHVYVYDGKAWTDLGGLGTNTQTYGFAVYRGSLFVSTWPEGKVYRLEEPAKWVDCGRLGEELEVMGLAVHGGSLFGGTLPTATVYRYMGGTKWVSAGATDPTPGVKFRRAWSFAEFGGRLYCGTLPSGRVFSTEAGSNVTYDREVPDGLHHIAAVRNSDSLILYLDGAEIARRNLAGIEQVEITSDVPIRVGHGIHDALRGKLGDLRIFRGGLAPEEIRRIAAEGR